MDVFNTGHETLYQIVFRNRNKDYGAYVQHKKYPRTLLISVITGVLILMLVIFIPFATYYFGNTRLLTDDDFIYEVEYMPISPPEPNEAQELARALTKPPEAEQVPVVRDTIVPEKEIKPPVDVPKENDDTSQTDSIGPGGGVNDGTGTGEATGLATVIDVYPRFPGGDEARLIFLKRSVRYPKAAMLSGTQGVVVVVFIIEPDGSLSNVKIEKSVGAGCDEEALRVVKLMPRWEPGKRQGRAVRVMVRMPIVFRIAGKPG
jgi:periplasmic protein TonB